MTPHFKLLGSTEFKYTFETVSTLRASGAHLANGADDFDARGGSDDDDVERQLQVVVPIVLGFILVGVLVGGVAVFLRRRGEKGKELWC